MTEAMAVVYADKLTQFTKILKQFDDGGHDPSARAILNTNIISPLVINHCNGVGSWSFSDATIDYKRLNGMPLHLWYNDPVMKIMSELQKKYSLNAEQRKAFECVLDFFSEDKHMKCLKAMLTGKKSELEVQAILAIHYFQPLVHACSYAIDNNHGKLRSCPVCKEEVNSEDTSFGNRKVWHGQADIVLRRSIVKVNVRRIDDAETELTSDDNTLEISIDDSNQIDNSTGEPSSKERKKDSDESSSDACSSDTMLSSSSFASIIEVKLENKKKKKAKSQALAQAIVNSFCEVVKDKSLKEKFVPSFMATEKEVRIMMYNCEHDMLLFSVSLQIWQTSDSLNISTLLYVWLALNFDKFDTNVPKYILDNFPKCNFKTFVGDSVYKIYSEEVTRPLPSRKGELHVRKEMRYSDKILSHYEAILAIQKAVSAAQNIYTGCDMEHS